MNERKFYTNDEKQQILKHVTRFRKKDKKTVNAKTEYYPPVNEYVDDLA